MSKGFHRLPADMPWSNRALPMMQALQNAPSHTDLMVGPESIDAFLDAQPMHVPHSEFEPGPPKMDRDQAKSAGFTGNTCNECGSMQMVRNGTCEKCNWCGATTGCS